jgi:hypothetical protein
VTSKKQALAYLVAVMLDRGRTYTATEIDRAVRDAIHPRWLTDPRFAPDHIRLAMIENGFMERDGGGDVYRLAASFEAAGDMVNIAARARELANASSARVSCPGCGYVCVPVSLPGHVEGCHGLQKWLALVDKYGS